MVISKEITTLLIELGLPSAEARAGNDTWYCQLAAALTSANQPVLVAEVYEVAIASNKTEEYLGHVFRRMKEALLKASFIYGVPKLLNSFYPLCRAHDRVYRSILEKSSSRSVGQNPFPGTEFIRESIYRPQDVEGRGMNYLTNMYRDDLPRMIEPLETFSQDIYQFALKFTYGYWLSDETVLSAKETALICVSTLVPLDLPVQVGWHSRGLIRNGGTCKDFEDATQIGLMVAKMTDAPIRHNIPTWSEIQSDQLFNM